MFWTPCIGFFMNFVLKVSDRNRQWLPIHWLILHMSSTATTRLGQNQGGPKLNLSHQGGWQGLKYLLPIRVHLSRKLPWKQSWDLNPGYPGTKWRHLNYYTKCLPTHKLFKSFLHKWISRFVLQQNAYSFFPPWYFWSAVMLQEDKVQNSWNMACSGGNNRKVRSRAWQGSSLA